MPNPEFIPIAFAENGVKNPIQKQLQPGQDPEDATWDSGWNTITMIPIEDGGLAPKGQDFNGLFNVLSQHAIHRQNGEQVKFSQDVVDEFGGYATGSIVQSDDGLREYRSLIDNNTFNPNTTPIANRWEIYTGVGSLPIASSSTAGITKVLNVLNSNDSGSALSAAQGKVLNDKLNFLNRKAANGYVRLGESGLVLQWGSVYVPGDNNITVNFPQPFSTACLCAQATLNSDNFRVTADAGVGTTWNRTQINLRNGVAEGCPVSWFAIGY